MGVKLKVMAFADGMMLLVIIILVATALFLCCYYWSKLSSEYESQSTSTEEKLDHNQIFINLEQLPWEGPLVYMPGHDLPAFIALPSHLHHHVLDAIKLT